MDELKLAEPIVVQATLEHPNVAYVQKSSTSAQDREEGTGWDERLGWWTMIYNVGFLLRTSTHEYFGSFAYTQRPNMKTRHDCISHCDRTFGSWYKDLGTGRLGCFYARKVQLFAAPEPPQSPALAEVDDVAMTASLMKQLKDIKYEDLEFLVKHINSQV